jgi:hypothetical protein
MKNLMFVIFAFVISVASVLYTQSHPLPPPYYGYDPDTFICTLGTIEGACGGSSSIRCSITIGGNIGLPAWDVKNGNTCAVAAFRP